MADLSESGLFRKAGNTMAIVEWIGRALLAAVTAMSAWGLNELRSINRSVGELNSRVSVVETKAIGNSETLQQMNQARQMLWDSINERLNRLEENILRQRGARFSAEALEGAIEATLPAARPSAGTPMPNSPAGAAMWLYAKGRAA